MHKEITLLWRNLNKSQANVSLNTIIQYGNCALTVLYVLCAFKTQNLMHDLCSFSIQTASTAWKTHRYIHIRGCGWSNCQERNIRLCRWQKNGGQNVKTKQFDCKNCTLLKRHQILHVTLGTYSEQRTQQGLKLFKNYYSPPPHKKRVNGWILHVNCQITQTLPKLSSQ